MLSNYEAIFKQAGIGVEFSYGDNPCLHIKNSYLIRGKNNIERYLRFIHRTDEYKKLCSVGYTRTFKGEINEWAGHNVLYRLGYKPHQTGSVDIDQKEPYWRRIFYNILSIFEVNDNGF